VWKAGVVAWNFVSDIIQFVSSTFLIFFQVRIKSAHFPPTFASENKSKGILNIQAFFKK